MRFFSGITFQLESFINRCYETPNTQNIKAITQFKEYLVKSEELYAESSQDYLRFVELTTVENNSRPYTEDQQRITQLIAQFYSEQLSIKENGRLKVLEILQFIENVVEKARRDVDELTQTMSNVSMEEQGAAAMGGASSVNISEGETSKVHQDVEDME